MTLTKLTRTASATVRTLAVSAAIALLPATGNASLSPKELRCRQALAQQTQCYFSHVEQARRRCLGGIFSGKSASSVGCIEGSGDERVQKRLEAARRRLDAVVARRCEGADLKVLGFPGPCSGGVCETDADCVGSQRCIANACTVSGAAFSSDELAACVSDILDRAIAKMLRDGSPPARPIGANDRNCVSWVGSHGAMLVQGEVRARDKCLLMADASPATDETLECRAQLVPYGDGTRDDETDRALLRGYVDLVSGLPRACSGSDLDVLGFTDDCDDPTGEPMTALDLADCLFDRHGAAAAGIVDAAFPRPPECGDGEICMDPTCTTGPAGGPEECDDGVDNSDTTPDACRSNCALPACGDDVVDSGEQCDDGSSNSDVTPNACRADCALPACGDGVIDDGEACDDGASNSDTQADACRTSCVLPTCGDWIVDSGESCDPPDGVACGDDCRPPLCGNGVLDEGEECDDGAGNSDSTPDACRTTCTNPRCGDGVVDPSGDEECDDGSANSDTDPDACRKTCVAPFCGDGVVDIGEGCDEGENNADGGTCLSSCMKPVTCTITFGVTSSDTLGALQYEVSYAAAAGGFEGSGLQVECASLLPGAFAQFSDDESKRVLSESIISTGGFTAPKDVASCPFIATDGSVSAEDFAVSILVASTPALEPAEPTVEVTNVECLPASITTGSIRRGTRADDDALARPVAR